MPPAGPIPIPYPTTMTAKEVKKLSGKHKAIKLKALEGVLEKVEKQHKGLDFSVLKAPALKELSRASFTPWAAMAVKFEGKAVVRMLDLSAVNRHCADLRKETPNLPPEVAKCLAGIESATKKLESDLARVDPKKVISEVEKALQAKEKAVAQVVDRALKPFMAGCKAFIAKPDANAWPKLIGLTGKQLATVLRGYPGYRETFGRQLDRFRDFDLGKLGLAGPDPKAKEKMVKTAREAEAMGKAIGKWTPS